MVRPVVSVCKKASARDVALQMMNGLYSGMPVNDDDGKVIGIITEIDILNTILDRKRLEITTAGDRITAKVIAVSLETPVSEIIKIMNEKGIIRIPVISKEGKLIGGCFPV